MGKVYRSKRRSCGLCKPNKMGRQPARSNRERALERADQDEIDNREQYFEDQRYDREMEELDARQERNQHLWTELQHTKDWRPWAPLL